LRSNTELWRQNLLDWLTK